MSKSDASTQGSHSFSPSTTRRPARWHWDAVQEFDAVNENLVPVMQADRDGVLIDTEDRVQVCVRLARALQEAGL